MFDLADDEFCSVNALVAISLLKTTLEPGQCDSRRRNTFKYNSCFAYSSLFPNCFKERDDLSYKFPLAPIGIKKHCFLLNKLS